VPRLRLQREVVVKSNSWFDPGLAAHRAGERAMCNFDEDAVTLAVEAARDCLTGMQAEPVTGLYLASTSLPYASRLNASIVAQALNLPDELSAMDITASQRGGTSALIHALRSNACGALVVASDRRKAKVASTHELTNGDAAAAVLVGGGEGEIAEALATHSLTVDMVDQYRGARDETNTYWEERWIRDEGHLKQIPAAIGAALKKANLAAAQVDRLCVAVPAKGLPQKLAKMVGIDAARVQDVLADRIGNTGAAHPLLMLADCLGRAEPGEVMVLASFGQGVDVLVLRATEALKKLPPRRGVAGWAAAGRKEESYLKFLAFNDLLPLEKGMRAEADKLTPLSVEYRNRRAVHGFMGGVCKTCGTYQWPRMDICVNPDCGAVGTQEEVPFADRPARLMSYTADRLAYSLSPPACYGMVEFEGGGRLMMDLTDLDAAQLQVSLPLRMSLRIKAVDAVRGFTRYFWKAAAALPLEN
jgi:3-hydroxy-3-methylglutaryl CoA synthase